MENNNREVKIAGLIFNFTEKQTLCTYCGSEDGYLQRDPYTWTVNGEERYIWLCDECWEERNDDI